MIAAWVAEHLREGNDIQVELAKGGFLELSVYIIDDHKVIETSPFWYPLPSRLVSTTRELLTKRSSANDTISQ